MSKLIRISDGTLENLESLCKLTGQSKQKLIDQAVTLYRHEQILKKSNEQYARLKQDSKAWQEMEEEREEWDITLNDGFQK